MSSLEGRPLLRRKINITSVFRYMLLFRLNNHNQISTKDDLLTLQFGWSCDLQSAALPSSPAGLIKRVTGERKVGN